MMTDCVFPADWKIRCVGRMRQPAESIEKTVCAIWKEELSREGSPAFNGEMFSVKDWSSVSNEILVELTEYRYFFAQRRDCRLGDALKLRPLAVTGLLKCEGGFVLGRRTSRVEMDAGLWESVPSGTVDGSALSDGYLDPADQIVKELFEEIGLEATHLISKPRPFLFVEDTQSHTVDICMAIETSLNRPQVESLFAQNSRIEYDGLLFILPSDIKSILVNSYALGFVTRRILEHFLACKDVFDPAR